MTHGLNFKTLIGSATAALLSSAAFGQATVQIVHAAPFASDIAGTSVTVTASGAIVRENFTLSEFTDDLELPTGDYDLAVSPT